MDNFARNKLDLNLKCVKGIAWNLFILFTWDMFQVTVSLDYTC